MNLLTGKAHRSKARNAVYSLLAWVQIILQVVLPLFSFASVSARADDQPRTHADTLPSSAAVSATDPDALPASATLSTVATSLSSSGAAGLTGSARTAAAGYAASSAQTWLNQFGTARIQLNVDENGNWDDSAFDFLAPLYDNKKSLLFTQLGLRAPDGRTTGNIGMGVRTFYREDWMFGANVFMDDDFTGKNRRIGIGAEAWTNNLKFSANTYMGTTTWHQSRDFADYNEKPADGYDIRAEGYLPAWPQLGGKLMYEQYYGENVALFDKDHLQHNPSAVTAGVNYTPVPLITFGVDYKRGQHSMDETLFGINLRYVPGQSWEQQLSPSQVALERSLQGSRYDLVERNNVITLQYKKKQQDDRLADMTLALVKDNSPADGVSANLVTLHAVTGSGAPARNAVINWTTTGTARLSATSSVTDSMGYATVSVADPAAEQVIVQATSGDVSRSVATTFIQSVSRLDLQLTQNNSLADGSAQNAGQLRVTDASGKALPNVAVTWKVNNGAVIVSSAAQTDEHGEAKVNFTSTHPGVVTLTASADNQTASIDSAFVANTIASLDVSTYANNAPADGISLNEVRAIVKDAANNPMPNVSVTWQVANSQTATLDNPTTLSDANGMATVHIKDSVAEPVSVTASAGTLTGTAQVTFSAIAVNAVTVTMEKDNAVADGAQINTARALVTDANGKPLAHTEVNWEIGGSGASATTPLTLQTNENGIATLSVNDRNGDKGEVVPLIAHAGGQQGQVNATFKPYKFGPVTNVELEHESTGWININTVIDGLDITVAPYEGMAEGDRITVNFNVTGTPAPKSSPLPNVTLPVHIVTAAEVGKPLMFTIAPDSLMNVESSGPGWPLEAVATVETEKPATSQHATGKSDTWNFDTLAS